MLRRTQFVAAMQVLQTSCDGGVLQFDWLSGNEACKIEAVATDTLVTIHSRLAIQLRVPCNAVDVIFPGGELLSNLLGENSEAMVSAVFTL